MKYLKTHWKSRLVIVLMVSVAISVLMIVIEQTDWAAKINQEGFSHGENGEPKGPSFLNYILPFVKELVLIGIPMGISLLILKVSNRKKRLFN